MGVFDQINAALTGKPGAGGGGGAPRKSGGGALNKVGYGGPGDMSPREAAMAKMKALGLSAMPEGGQAQLDQMWGAHVKKVNAASGQT